MRKRIKGFTLIELLAVIVILAVILLIVVPIVLNVIGDARKGAFESSAMGLVKTAENACMSYALRHDPVARETLFADGEMSGYELNFTGKPPVGGYVYINEQCEIQLAVHNNEWCAIKDYDELEVTLVPYDGDCGLSSGIGENDICGEDIVDVRDGQIYSTVQIGNQCWLRENLKYLPEVHTHEQFFDTECETMDNPFRYAVMGYDGTDVAEAKNHVNYETYGVLYNFFPAHDNNICPAGWEVPTDKDFDDLESYLKENECCSSLRYDQYDGSTCVGIAANLAGNESLWPAGNLTGHADFGTTGFNALPGGVKLEWNATRYFGDATRYWTSSQDKSSLFVQGWTRMIRQEDDGILKISNSARQGAYVRCVRPQTIEESIVWGINEGEYPILNALSDEKYLGSFLKPITQVSVAPSCASPITNLSELQAIDNLSTSYYILMNDIELPEDYVPITMFRGIFDGNGYKLYGGSINMENQQSIGVFARTNEGVIKNLGVEDMVIVGGDRTGGIVGYNNGGTIYNSYAYNNQISSISGFGTAAGGLAGYNWGGRISNVYSSDNVINSDMRAGGIAGLHRGTMENVYNTSSVQGRSWVGGIAGLAGGAQHMLIKNAANYGNIIINNAGKTIGGIVGAPGFITISNCYNAGEFINPHNGKIIGGIIGNSSLWGGDGTIIIENCYNVSDIDGDDSIGGISGAFEGTIPAIVRNTYTSGIITGNEDIGEIGGLIDNVVLENVHFISDLEMRNINTFLPEWSITLNY